MLTIYDDTTLQAALTTPLDKTCADLIECIASDARASDLWELTCIVVVENGDTAEEFEDVLGYSPSTGPLGSEGEAYWSWLERHDGWHEMLITAGDTGFAYFVLIPDTGEDLAGLARLCRRFSS